MSPVGDDAITSPRKIRNQLPVCEVPPPRRKTRKLFVHWKQPWTKLKRAGLVKHFATILQGRWLFKDRFKPRTAVAAWKNGVRSVIFC